MTSSGDAQVAANQAAAAKLGITIPGVGGTSTTPATSGAGTSTTSSSANDDFFNALNSKLMSQSDMISSSNTGIEDKIQQAIKGIQSGNADSAKATSLDYAGQEQNVLDQAAQTKTGIQDRQAGFATNSSVLRLVNDTTTKQIDTLEKNKQELILQGNAAAAGQISQLQVQALQMQQQAQQQSFTNMLSLAGVNLQQMQFKQSQTAQQDQEDQAKGQIALQYGVQVQPGDTLSDVINRAQPFASKAQQLQMEQLQTSIDSNKAQTASALNSLKNDQPLDDTSLTALAVSYQQDPTAVLGVVKTTAQLSQILGKVGDLAESTNKSQIDSMVADGSSDLPTVIAQITSSKSLSPSQQADLVKYAQDAYSKAPAPQSFFGGLGASGNSFNSWVDSIVNPSGKGIL